MSPEEFEEKHGSIELLKVAVSTLTTYLVMTGQATKDGLQGIMEAQLQNRHDDLTAPDSRRE